MSGRKFTIFFICGLIFINPKNSSAQTTDSFGLSVKEFLQTLTPEQLKVASRNFEDTSRVKWTNLPVGLVPRPGVQYGSLSDKSKMALHRVLTNLLSSQGYLKITSIMQLDDILNTLIQQAYDRGGMSADMLKQLLDLKWGHANYFISVWGEPQGNTPWTFSLAGHHMAIQITTYGNKISVTPLFLGTDPSEVKTDKYAGWRVLSKEEDYGFSLVNFLTEQQRKKAVLIQKIPGDIITNPNSSQRITSYSGIAVSEFNDDQKAILEYLIKEYIHNFEHETAHRLWSKILTSGLNKIYFAWVGSLEHNKPHYYIVNGPDFLIEYDNVGFQNDGNHIHLILREKENDFGADILKDHYLNSEPHKK